MPSGDRLDLHELMARKRRGRGGGIAAPGDESELHRAAGWLDRLREPVVLRLPRAYLLLLLLAGLAMLTLAYWVGRSRQPELVSPQALSSTDTARPPEPGSAVSLPRDPTGSPRELSSQSTAQTDPPAEPKIDPMFQERRRNGLNYIVLPLVELDEAKRMVQFLAQQGVESMIVSTHNARLFNVIELTGFEADQLGGAVFREHKTRLQRLGLLWKQKYRGTVDFFEVGVRKYNP